MLYGDVCMYACVCVCLKERARNVLTCLLVDAQTVYQGATRLWIPDFPGGNGKWEMGGGGFGPVLLHCWKENFWLLFLFCFATHMPVFCATF